MFDTSELKSIPLTEAFEVRSGLSKPASDFGAGYPFVTFKDVMDNFFLPECLSNLVQSTEKDRLGCSVQRGDVFLTRTSETQADLGLSSVALRDYPEATFNGFTKRLRPKGNIEIVPEFSAYYFRGPQFRSEISAFSTLSTRASLNNDMLSRLTIRLPKLDTQEAIGSCLKSLDDKIEQNRRTAGKLEELARAVFRAWFVDFAAVHAKAAGATTYPGLPQAAFDALPTTFVDSELGMIPEGWEVKRIEELVTIKGGATPSTKNEAYWDGGTHCWATPKDLSSLDFPVLLETNRHITDAGRDRISSGLLPTGTVLMSSRAPVGYLAIAEVPTAINQGFIAMICDERLPNVYLLRWLESAMDVIKGNAAGTTFAEISKKNFRPILLAVPCEKLLDEFEHFSRSLYELMVANERESNSLAALRDYLLPRLLSGSVRVRDAESAVEATV